jgi:hypothetical protein
VLGIGRQLGDDAGAVASFLIGRMTSRIWPFGAALPLGRVVGVDRR